MNRFMIRTRRAMRTALVVSVTAASFAGPTAAAQAAGTTTTAGPSTAPGTTTSDTAKSLNKPTGSVTGHKIH